MQASSRSVDRASKEIEALKFEIGKKKDFVSLSSNFHSLVGVADVAVVAAADVVVADVDVAAGDWKKFFASKPGNENQK